MTKGYILQDLESKEFVVSIYKPWEPNEYTLTYEIGDATILSETDVFQTIESISKDHTSECYMKNFLQLTVWIT
jgi:hypothetical protein